MEPRREGLPPGVLKVIVGEDEMQERSSSLDQQNPGIKEEEEEADITKLSFCLFPVKSEDNEEKLQSSQLHHGPTEEDRNSFGGPESGPVQCLEPEGETSESSETDVSDGDWEESSEARFGLNSVKTNKPPAADTSGDEFKKPFSCSECGRRFGRRGHVKQHLKTHTGEKPFSCTECSKTFGRIADLKAHMRIHTGEKPFSCSFCHKKFTWQHHMKRHQRVCPSVLFGGSKSSGNSLPDLETVETYDNDQKTFSCPKCGKKYIHSGNLIKHLSSHSGKCPFSCSECDRTFNDKTMLTNHLRTHSGEKPFSCSECGKRFGHRGNLRKHLRTHSGEKPFSCSVCGKTFSYSLSLKYHLTTHTGDKPFSCSECSKTFGFKSDLKVHMRIHTGEKRFTCSFCPKKFTRKHHMQDHQRVCHSAE
ncbi:uncharacterized protein PAE49_019922 [Odontesthes bonariensis]|uniref:uncharacterized protein LOC142367168 n=1 Tax=Odontesthes bonariensis TaxID=219752 RepID=UPI003F5896D1